MIQNIKDEITIFKNKQKKSWQNRTLELNNKEFQNTVKTFNNKLDQAEERISELEEQCCKLTHMIMKKKEF